MFSRGYIYAPYTAYDNPSGITPPEGAALLWRPSQLSASENQSISLLEDEGSLEWDLSPRGTQSPIYQTISGIPSLRYSGAAGNLCTVMGSNTFTDHSLPVTTGLFIFNPTDNTTVASMYLGDTGIGGTTKRLGLSMNNASNVMFAYRGGILNTPTPKPAINTWHYFVGYYNGHSSQVNLNGNQIATGSVGTSTLIPKYNIGAYDTTTNYRFIGNIADVGFWPGDKRTEVEAYARAILGLS